MTPCWVADILATTMGPGSQEGPPFERISADIRVGDQQDIIDVSYLLAHAGRRSLHDEGIC